MNRSERLRNPREDLHLSQVYVAKHIEINLPHATTMKFINARLLPVN